MDKIFTLKNYKIASLIFAFLFLFFGVFKVNDISKFSMEVLLHPSIVSLTIGFIFLIISIALYLEIGIDLFSLNRVHIKRLKDDSLCTRIGKTNLIVHFDKLQEISKKENSVVVLPANEYFDDECINDRKSSLGAYIDKYFRNHLNEFQNLVSLKLTQNCYVSNLHKKKEDENEQKSYGIGACVFLDKPLNTSEKILLVSVTEQRAGIGLYSNISFVYKAVNEIYKKVVDNRIKNIYIPLLGSGHGGLNKRVALLNLVTAFTEPIIKANTDKIENINIVIYKDGDKIDIMKNIVKKIIKFGVGLAVSTEKPIEPKNE
jgi:hypothetical protein